jgi:hypothetical protein
MAEPEEPGLELQGVLAFLERHFPSAAEAVLRELAEAEAEAGAGEVGPASGTEERASGDEGDEGGSQAPSKSDDGSRGCVRGAHGDLALTPARAARRGAPGTHTRARYARRHDAGDVTQGSDAAELPAWQGEEAGLTRRLSGARRAPRRARRAARCGQGGGPLGGAPGPSAGANAPVNHAAAAAARGPPARQATARRAAPCAAPLAGPLNPRAPAPLLPPPPPRPRPRAGSTRLYEDPDIDEYDGADDAGYWRREVARQDEFVAVHLERLATVRPRRRAAAGMGRGAGVGAGVE